MSNTITECVARLVKSAGGIEFSLMEKQDRIFVLKFFNLVRAECAAAALAEKVSEESASENIGDEAYNTACTDIAAAIMKLGDV